MNMDHHKPHPDNAPGDFFVEDGCCTSCGVPMAEAPELFSWNETQCYVSRQPTRAAELGRMLRVLRQQDVYCIHYKGNNPRLVKEQGQRDAEERRIKAEWAAKKPQGR